jgi:hypothetical protein
MRTERVLASRLVVLANDSDATMQLASAFGQKQPSAIYMVPLRMSRNSTLRHSRPRGAALGAQEWNAGKYRSHRFGCSLCDRLGHERRQATLVFNPIAPTGVEDANDSRCHLKVLEAGIKPLEAER